MADNPDAGGIHYHYHFYGSAPQSMGPGQQYAGFSAPPPGWSPWPAEANPHQHPGADALIKGLAVGAGAAWLLSNETVQRSVMRTAFQLWAVLQSGVEEIKERIRDAEAEAAAAASQSEAEAVPADERQSAEEPKPFKGRRRAAS